MGLRRIHWGGFLLFWVFCILCFRALCDVAEVSVKFLQAPSQFSRHNSATFVFDAYVGASRKACSDCSFNYKLDGGTSSDCGARNVSFVGLKDGNHSLEICTNSSQGAGCATYNWIVDTVHPTAYISTSTSFTSAVNISVYISFSEPCTGEGGFRCSSVDACNLLVYGSGQVIPNTLQTIQPNLKYSILVGLSSEVQYGRVILVMDKGFCTDRAGNRFIRLENSSSTIHFDRRSVMVSLRTHVPERLLVLNGETRTVQATNDPDKLKVYLYFNEPVLNTSTEIMKSIHINQGSLRPINSSTLANTRFGYQVAIEDVPGVTVVSVDLNSSYVISRQGIPVSPAAPATFLYDSTRPVVKLRTRSKMRTRDSSITVSIKFLKPVFGFNSNHLSISGGHVDSFEELSRSWYIAIIQAYEGIISVSIPENVTADVAGNPNMASNTLQLRHYSVPMISTVFCILVTALFVATCLVAGLLTICTASLQSAGAFPISSATLTSNATKNLFRIVCYIQVFAFSRWLAVTLPVEYYEFARCIEWSVPYFNLPYESNDARPALFAPNISISWRPSLARVVGSYFVENVQLDKGSSNKAGAVYGAPLTVAEYQSIFENQNYIPEATYISDHDSSTGWRTFKRSMFWLAVIGGSLILFHAFLLLVLRFRKSSVKEKSYGALVFPRFEIFLTIVAVPCICLASAAIIKGGTTLGIVIGVFLLILVSSLQFALFSFLTFGITLGRLLQYKEVHKMGQKHNWYHEVVRVSLGPGKRGQWTWKDQPNSKPLIMFGAMFEDLRGPPKYMLSMISSGGRLPLDRIIASDDENEDAEAPFIQKLFGILRIYYTLLESLKRFILGILCGLYIESSSSSTSKGPTLTLLCITSFQLFFLCLKKPFIKRKAQLVEIISITCELGLFVICLALLDRKDGLSIEEEKSVGILMLFLFIIGFISLMCNEWYALFKQVTKLDTSQNSFRGGLRTAGVGFLLLFLPEKLTNWLEKWLPEDKGGVHANGTHSTSSIRGMRTSSGRTNRGMTSSSGSRSSSSMSENKPWMKQLREMAKASFREGSSTNGGGGAGNEEPSTSTRWSGLWRGRESGTSSKNSGSNSSDFKARPRSLYKDLEAIFAPN